MKTLSLLVYLLLGSLAFGQSPTPGVTDVADLSAIKVQTPDRGVMVAGDIRDVLANYPTFASNLKTQVKARFDALDDQSAAKLWKDIQARNIALPTAATNAINTRIDAIRARLETALRTVAATNPQRAAQKLAEWNAALPPANQISQATQDIVNAANPTPTPTASPSPTPNDGL